MAVTIAKSDVYLARVVKKIEATMIATELLDAFTTHSERLRDASRRRRDAVRLKAAVLDTESREEVSADDALGKWQPNDEFQGDVNLRTLRALLTKIDELGFERCAATRVQPRVQPRVQKALIQTRLCAQVGSPTQVSRRV